MRNFKVVAGLLLALSAFPALAEDGSRSYSELIMRADSLYGVKNYKEASAVFGEAFKFPESVRGSHLYNAACVAALAGDTAVAIDRLFARVRLEPDWYNDKIGADPDLSALRGTLRWKELQDTFALRRERIEKDYDKPLLKELRDIGASDQNVRWRYLNALKETPQDSARVQSLIKEMVRTDSINQQRIYRILDERGWVSQKLVGGANQVIWLVIQHSDLEHIQKYLPLFREAAEMGELPKENVALMEDRCLIWSGKPQKYGTQLERDESGKLRPSKLLDASKVDEWRKEAGMPPLDEYVRQMNSR